MRIWKHLLIYPNVVMLLKLKELRAETLGILGAEVLHKETCIITFTILFFIQSIIWSYRFISWFRKTCMGFECIIHSSTSTQRSSMQFPASIPCMTRFPAVITFSFSLSVLSVFCFSHRGKKAKADRSWGSGCILTFLLDSSPWTIEYACIKVGNGSLP